MDEVYDLVVIGAGPAGEVAAELAAAFGRRALIVERDKPGGVVTTTGGAPTKALREAAVDLTGYRQEEVYGVRARVPTDQVLPILRARVERVRDVLQEAVEQRLAAHHIGYLRGTARLGRDRTVYVTGPGGVEHRLAARSILLATGSRPTHFAGVPFDDPDVYDSDEVYSLRTVPDDIVVVGGGAVGVEFATVLTALGIPATLISRADRLLPSVDDELAGLAAAEFRRRGVTLVLGAGAEKVCREGGQAERDPVHRVHPDGRRRPVRHRPHAQHRRPRPRGSRRAARRPRADRRRPLLPDDAPGIYAAGDVVDPGLASYAMQQGRAAAAHACGLMFGVVVDRTPSSAVYGLPEVASVGATEEQTRAAGIPYAVGRCDLALTARGAIAGHGGLLKLVIRADDRTLLGVHCFGDAAAEVVNLGHVVVQGGGSVESFLTMALNTPTYSYAYHDAAVDGLMQLSRMMGLANAGSPTPPPPWNT